MRFHIIWKGLKRKYLRDLLPVKLCYLAIPYTVYEQSIGCCVWLNFHLEIYSFPRHVMGNLREEVLVCHRMEGEIKTVSEIWSQLWIRESTGCHYILSLFEHYRRMGCLFLPIDFREMGSSCLPACPGHSSSQRQRSGLHDLSRSLPNL